MSTEPNRFQFWVAIFIVVFVCISVGILLKDIVPIPPFLPGNHGPLSLDDALKIKDLSPLYYPDPDDDHYSELGLTYYYHVNLAELSIFTYFTDENQGKAVRVAKMETFINYFPYNLNVSTNRVPINWASTGYGRTCEIPSNASKRDRILGDPYQSCLYWSSERDYVLYSIWSEDETVDFVSSLVEVKKD